MRTREGEERELMVVTCSQEHRKAAQVTCTPMGLVLTGEVRGSWPQRTRNTVACGQTGREEMKGGVTRDERGRNERRWRNKGR